MGSRIKIVPDETPNADGEWITITADTPQTSSWVEAAKALEPFIPKGHHLVALGGRTPVEGDRFSGLDI